MAVLPVAVGAVTKTSFPPYKYAALTF